MKSYQQDNAGKLLAEAFFLPEPVMGYGTQRALTVGTKDVTESLLRQGKTYHQQKDFDLALVSLRAYFDEVAVEPDYLPYLLAVTAAMATGHYKESVEHLNEMPRTKKQAEAAYRWYASLLSLRQENVVEARLHLEQLLALQPQAYPASELMDLLP